MTGNLYLDLLISLGGIGFVVGLAALLGAGEPILVTEENARDRVAFDEPDFIADNWFVDTRGKGALGIGKGIGGEAAEAVVVFRLGDRLATRRFDATNHSILPISGGLRVVLGDVSKGHVDLFLPSRDLVEALFDGLKRKTR
ncbi:MAG: hypothetical protein AAFR21_06610 [Pseudomonadota bacterium]